MKYMFQQIKAIYLNNIMLFVWLVGLTSGLSIMISSNTLNFWLAKNNVSITEIGLFSIISLPYAINFLWAPIIDIIEIPYFSNKFGQRKAWIIVLGGLLLTSIKLLSIMSPQRNLLLLAIIGFSISFFSSSLDVVFGALRSESLKDRDHGPASGVYLFGYRLGMIISKSGAIYLSSFFQWAVIYNILIIILITLLIAIFYLTPYYPGLEKKHFKSNFKSIKEFFIEILKPIGNKYFIIILLLFLIMYRLPDNILNNMINPFLLEIGFNEKYISAGYLSGSIFSIIGGMIAGIIIEKISIYRSLFYFGVIHAFAHLLFTLFFSLKANPYTLAFVIGIEGLTGGMAMASYIALITSLCKGKYKGTQYSLFSAMMGISRAFIPSLSGFLVLYLGWSYFFVLIFILTFPSLLLLKQLNKKIHE